MTQGTYETAVTHVEGVHFSDHRALGFHMSTFVTG